MPAVAVNVAEAVKNMIAAAQGDLSTTDFTLERSYADWRNDLLEVDADGNELRVDVVTAINEQKIVLDTQENYEYEIAVDVAVRKRLGEEEQSEEAGKEGRPLLASVDALMLLTQDMLELFIPNRLTNLTDAVWQRTTILVAPHREHLTQNKQFTSVVRSIFAVDRDV